MVDLDDSPASLKTTVAKKIADVLRMQKMEHERRFGSPPLHFLKRKRQVRLTGTAATESSYSAVGFATARPRTLSRTVVFFLFFLLIISIDTYARVWARRL